MVGREHASLVLLRRGCGAGTIGHFSWSERAECSKRGQGRERGVSAKRARVTIGTAIRAGGLERSTHGSPDRPGRPTR